MICMSHDLQNFVYTDKGSQDITLGAPTDKISDLLRVKVWAEWLENSLTFGTRIIEVKNYSNDITDFVPCCSWFWIFLHCNDFFSREINFHLYNIHSISTPAKCYKWYSIIYFYIPVEMNPIQMKSHSNPKYSISKDSFSWVFLFCSSPSAFSHSKETHVLQYFLTDNSKQFKRDPNAKSPFKGMNFNKNRGRNLTKNLAKNLFLVWTSLNKSVIN